MIRFGYVFLTRISQNDVVPMSVHNISRFRMLTCLSTDYINLDHLVKVVTAGFLHCKVPIFLFVI